MTREEFWSLVDTSSADGCWPWLGPQSQGRGRVLLPRGKYAYAYRYFYQLIGYEIPIGSVVCHRCDNPICVRPSHLFVGTQADNMRDASEKGRVRGKPAPTGAAHWNAHSSDNDVAAARRLRAAGMSQAALAELFGVSQSTVSRWVLGQVRQAVAS